MKTGYMLNDGLYQAFKWIALIALPAFGTAYASLAPVWNLPYATELPQSAQILALFLGALIGVSHLGAGVEVDDNER